MLEDLLGGYFSAREFYCQCGCGLGVEAMQPAFLHRLIAARSLSAAPFVINSSIRCRKHNATVGGVDASAHVGGWAADIAAVSSPRRYQILIAAQTAGFNRIGIGSKFVHLDCDPGKPGHVVWTY